MGNQMILKIKICCTVFESSNWIMWFKWSLSLWIHVHSTTYSSQQVFTDFLRSETQWFILFSSMQILTVVNSSFQFQTLRKYTTNSLLNVQIKIYTLKSFPKSSDDEICKRNINLKIGTYKGQHCNLNIIEIQYSLCMHVDMEAKPAYFNHTIHILDVKILKRSPWKVLNRASMMI